ncbi:MAG: hypothetical protein ABEJ87_01640 [Candidatus Nanohalobium sp.]
MEIREFWENLQERELFREFYFLGIALILAFGTLQTAGTVLHTQKPVVSVVSCSMYPEPGEHGLHKGDILLVQGTNWNDIKVGDTVVYKVPDHIEFNVGGKKYTLEASDSNPHPSVDTAAGRVVLEKVARGPGVKDKALISIDGRKKVVDEGESYQINGKEFNVGSISTMPIPVVHRVVSKSKSHLETKGINNPGQLDFEQHVKPDQIYGTVATIIPRVGLIKILAMDFLGFNGDKPFVLDVYHPCKLEA